ncbi:hypothetical protein Scep_007998 [Stephania cephalantha]|uniref:Uncharacterized protein n=1 Tax=Stephania cephalantha TaxID=152367 RepID=A0AAP0KAV9_9MAGN
MDASMNDFDRFILNEHERKLCDAAYAINPLDADNLAKWGGALLELSQFQGSPSEMTQMLKGKCCHFISLIRKSDCSLNKV